MLCGLFLETPSLKLIETEGQEAGQCSGARSPSPHGSLAVPVTRRVASASAQPLGHPDSVFCAMLAQRRIGNRDTWVPALPGGRLGRPGRLRVPSEPQGCPPTRRRRRSACGKEAARGAARVVFCGGAVPPPSGARRHRPVLGRVQFP